MVSKMGPKRRAGFFARQTVDKLTRAHSFLLTCIGRAQAVLRVASPFALAPSGALAASGLSGYFVRLARGSGAARGWLIVDAAGLLAAARSSRPTGSIGLLVTSSLVVVGVSRSRSVWRSICG